MMLIALILSWIVAFEHLFIMILEMFFSTTSTAQNAFELKPEFLNQKEAKSLMANQGLYNGFIGVGLMVVLLILSGAALKSMLLLFTGFVFIAAVFGSLTAAKKIILVQGLPALLAFIAIALAL
ncbi:DUF1304 domain-containing protein [Dellaglioa sp. TMW 2.2444]|uniref:DUF1304 domain-containing protein n=2 Tax=Dellaglioa carnosa TaxID=2995136 RepID=A0ABT4JLV8_9LACO|nr:DUF1304 domain-containing protein [Dellaglioa carnosa]MCZ2491350.1 DUF1304 domain-containing protein [Dellaglioa carnosa]MCZ2492895.1 DUF1304 domain-containing protein [Dellaglioa carnosa]MCZ2494428.1 DUF1304 domain-containing protein [Dellaglioa carnosa]MDK1731156.1 DUF1304 domain-containing protein [Dellaglioa carnosa]